MTFDLSKLDAEKAVEFTGVALEALGVINKLVDSAVSDTAADIVTVIRAILKSLADVHDGKANAARAHDSLAKLLADLASNDATADRKLKKDHET